MIASHFVQSWQISWSLQSCCTWEYQMLFLPKSQSYNFTSSLGVRYWGESLIAQRGREMTHLLHPLLSCSSFLLHYFNKNSSNKTILQSTSCAFLSGVRNPSYILLFFPLSAGHLLHLLTYCWFYLMLFTVFKQRTPRLKVCSMVEWHHKWKQGFLENNTI